MKILIVIENYLPHIGGVETVFRNLSEGLVKKGHSVTIITHRLKGTKKKETIGGVQVCRIQSLKSRYIFTFTSMPKALSLAREADIIHTTTYNGALPALIASRLSGKPSLITVHELLGENWNTFPGMSRAGASIHRFLERRIARLPFDIFVAVSKSTASQIAEAGVKKDKIRVVYNGLDYDHFDPSAYDSKKIRQKLDPKSDRFIILGYGRPGISKGFEYLIDAFPAIKNKITNARLVLILSKSPKDRYRAIKAKASGSAGKDNILIHDPVSYKDLPAYLKASDCVVVPSITEGFGYTAAESCAMGVPIVATQTTSLPEVCSGNFVLVKPKDSKAIAKGVIELSKKMDRTCPIKRFTIKDNIDGYLNIYGELISRGSGKRKKY